MADIKFMKVDGLDAIVVFMTPINNERATLKAVQHEINMHLDAITLRDEEAKRALDVSKLKQLKLEVSPEISFKEDEHFKNLRNNIVSQVGQDEFEKRRYTLDKDGKIGPRKVD